MVNGDRLWPLSLSSTSATLLLAISTSLLQASADSISTNTQVPPLQWINLSGSVQGSRPQGLKDASIGYDSTQNRIIVFGGESAQGVPTSQTFLLDLASLTWSAPQPPHGLTSTPPARSAAVSAQDFAASYRNGHVVIGGRGNGGSPLNDVWEFDFTSQFWSEVQVSGGPSARWGAAGGSDPSTAFNPSTLANSFYMAGGFTADGAASLSDLWQLDITGTLSSNLPNKTTGTWTQIHLQNTSLPSTGGSGHAVILEQALQHVVAVGGCSSASGSTAACAQGPTYVIDVSDKNDVTIASCPAPRVGASLASNKNTNTSSFSSQLFLLLGTFNSSQWQDDNGLEQGEVDVLDIGADVWARILPAGDPSSDSRFPSPREGAAVITLPSVATGSAEAFDTVVFGGRDAKGNYLSELWVLRAYNASLTQSNQHWSGFGDGNLQGGPDADGQGVTVQYMTQCATQLTQTTGTGSSSLSPTSSGSPSPTNSPGSSLAVSRFDTSTIHKSLAPVSAALILPATVFYRLSQPSVASTRGTNGRIGFFYLTSLTALVAFALGIGGLATAFTSLQYTSSVAKRSGVTHLSTAHGRAGIALFVGLYGLIPALIAVSVLLKRRDDDAALAAKRQRTTSNDMAEKVGLRSGSPFTPDTLPQEPQAPERARSGDTWPLGHVPGTRRSSESAADDRSSPSTKSFEVTNRPQRARHASAHSLAAFSDPRSSAPPRNMSDLSWIERRRSINTAGEIDYVNSQSNRRALRPSTPGTTVLEGMSMKSSVLPDTITPGQPVMPSALDSVIHILLHAFLIALCILSIIALFDRANIATFAVFIAWTACFYILVFALAWHGIPSESILTVFVTRLRHPHRPDGALLPQDGVPFPTTGNGPYQHHQPNYRVASDDYPTSISHGGHTLEDEYDDDEDDETRQRRIEEEMNRRDVSIVTVPRRRLVITNPEAR